MAAEPRYTNIGNVGTVCDDCGVIVANREAHTRFHLSLRAPARPHTRPVINDECRQRSASA